MKMHPDHFEQLSKAVNQVIHDNPDALQNYKNGGLSMMRYRWDMYHLACWVDKYHLANQLYQYCNDENIDTALRKITNTQ